jgi:hypothetical protein
LSNYHGFHHHRAVINRQVDVEHPSAEALRQRVTFLTLRSYVDTLRDRQDPEKAFDAAVSTYRHQSPLEQAELAREIVKKIIRQYRTAAS